MPKITKNPRSTINKIMDAAEAEFEEFSLEDARISRIADRAGTSKQIIYNYFHKKESLYAAVVNRLTEKHRDYLVKNFVITSNSCDNLSEFTSRIFDMFASHEGRLETKFISHVSSSVKEIKYPDGSSKSIDLLDNILKRGFNSGTIYYKGSATDLYCMIISLCFSFNYIKGVFGEIRRLNAEVAVDESYWRSRVIESVLKIAGCKQAG